MKIESMNYTLSVCLILAAFVLLPNSARATGNPGLAAQADETHLDPSQNFQQDIQISEAGCLRLLEKIEIDEYLREQAVDVVMSSNIIARKRILLACSAYYDNTKLLVRRITRLLQNQAADEGFLGEGSIERSGNHQVLFKPAYRNELGQAVFKTLPVCRTWVDQVSESTMGWNDVGDYVDVNADGLLDYVVSYIDNRGKGDAYYKATFLNNGNSEWIMVACEGTAAGWFRFTPCQ